jgi:hypothetical protein
MAREIKDSGRVTVFKLLHMWSPRRVAIAVYTSTGNFGDTAVLGYIPFQEIPDVSLMDVASRHKPSALWGSNKSPEACWLICTGTSSRLVRKPGTLEYEDVAWSLETEASADLGSTMYGHKGVMVGRFRFEDPELMRQAKAMLLPEDMPVLDASDMPAHSS